MKSFADWTQEIAEANNHEPDAPILRGPEPDYTYGPGIEEAIFTCPGCGCKMAITLMTYGRNETQCRKCKTKYANSPLNTRKI